MGGYEMTSYVSSGKVKKRATDYRRTAGSAIACWSCLDFQFGREALPPRPSQARRVVDVVVPKTGGGLQLRLALNYRLALFLPFEGKCGGDEGMTNASQPSLPTVMMTFLILKITVSMSFFFFFSLSLSPLYAYVAAGLRRLGHRGRRRGRIGVRAS